MLVEVNASERGWSLAIWRSPELLGVLFGRGRFVVRALFVLVALLWPTSAALSADSQRPASAVQVPAPLMQAAECMASVVRALPGVTDVEINVSAGNGGAYPVLEFRSVDAAGRRRFTELMLFEISGANDAFVFDRADIENDPVANRVLPEWTRRCHAGVGVITSEPGL